MEERRQSIPLNEISQGMVGQTSILLGKSLPLGKASQRGFARQFTFVGLATWRANQARRRLKCLYSHPPPAHILKG